MIKKEYSQILFIKGPISIDLLSITNKLKCTDVLLTIWLQASMERNFILHLKPSLFDKMGIERTKRYRGIEKLKKEGILKVLENKTGKTCTIELNKEKLGSFMPF